MMRYDFIVAKTLFISEPPCFTQLLFEGDDIAHKYPVPVLRFMSLDTLFHPRGSIDHRFLEFDSILNKYVWSDHKEG